MRAILNLRNEPRLRDEFQYAHVVNSTVLIDRRTRWGNPFRIGEDGTRDEVIARYREHLWRHIQAGDVSLEELAELDGCWLACWCEPLALSRRRAGKGGSMGIRGPGRAEGCVMGPVDDIGRVWASARPRGRSPGSIPPGAAGRARLHEARCAVFALRVTIPDAGPSLRAVRRSPPWRAAALLRFLPDRSGRRAIPGPQRRPATRFAGPPLRCGPSGAGRLDLRTFQA